MSPNLVPLRRLVLVFAGLTAVAVLLIAGFVGYAAYTLPLSRSPAAGAPTGAFLYATSAGAPFAARGAYHGEPLTAGNLPADLVKAVIAIEDRRYYDHPGVDLHGIARAAWNNLWSREIEGGSTITQQLARLTYLSSERSLRRKVQEAILALWLDARLSKQEILARYLNSVYLGAGAVGADAAARRYFGKRANELNLSESAMLAGLIRAPSQLAPNRNLAGARRRAAVVLDAMVETGAVDQARAEAAKIQPVQLALAPEPQPEDNYFIDAAEAEVKRLIGSPPLDLSIATTFDPRLQDVAQRVVKNWLGAEGARRNVGQAALVAMAPDGAILAMVGGRDYAESQFNRATHARRQPGSLFKVFVYLTALSSGYRPDTVMVDEPVQIGDWQPRNYDGRHRGAVTLRTAFAHSINSVAAQLAQAVGIERVIETARSLGVESELPAVPSLALGTAEVTLIEMIRAIDAIATNSKSIEPYAVRAIRTPAAVLYTRAETAPERPDWDWAAMMQLLEAVVTEGTGRAARLPRRSAGKTGTTDEYRDAWFVGFTTDMVVGVWVGNDDNSPMNEVTGGDIPAGIWHDFMVQAQRVLAKPMTGRQPSDAAAVSGASAPPRTAAQPEAAVPAAAASEAQPSRRLRGVPQVIDTGTLMIDGTSVPLRGVAGEAGEPAEGLVRYLAGRTVDCEAAEDEARQYRCKIGDYDLGEAVLLNGAGRATADAPERLRRAERKARRAGRGVWAR